MANVLIRNLDDNVLKQLKAAAKAQGRSLQAEIHEVLRTAGAIGRCTIPWRNWSGECPLGAQVKPAWAVPALSSHGNERQGRSQARGMRSISGVRCGCDRSTGTVRG